MNRNIDWTIIAISGESGNTAMRTIGTQPTKRLAVQAMEALRKPNTAITQQDHTFVFHAR